MQSNKNFDWMAESISENLKAEILKTGNFQVMDATLLRKVNPDIKFAKLTDKEATAIATRLNCEGAVIGRYFITKKDGKDNALVQIETVDAIAKKSLLIKSEYADIDGAIFTTVQSLAEIVAKDFDEKLSAYSSIDTARNVKLERLILRMENPPKGFLDSLQVGDLTLTPEFDIDIFEYEASMPQSTGTGSSRLDINYEIWGKRFTPLIKGDGVHCEREKCAVEKTSTQFAILRENNDKSAKYTIRIGTAKQSRLIMAVWALAGYPLMVPFQGVSSNPSAMVPEGPLPLDLLRGGVAFEFGVVPGFAILPLGLRWSVITQSFYGFGAFPEYASTYTKVNMNFLSIGLGARLERPIELSAAYAISPFIGATSNYQRFFRSFANGYLNLISPGLEIGLSQYLRLKQMQNWRILLSIAGGIFVYNNQNLSYLRFSMGVDYAFK